MPILELVIILSRASEKALLVYHLLSQDERQQACFLVTARWKPDTCSFAIHKLCEEMLVEVDAGISVATKSRVGCLLRTLFTRTLFPELVTRACLHLKLGRSLTQRLFSVLFLYGRLFYTLTTTASYFDTLLVEDLVE